jgi:glycosyltransferase involved in cell wall biosynthesis
MPACPLPSGASFRERHELTDGPLVVFLGMLSPRKQPDVLARAIAELRRSDVQLVFAGNDMGAERRTRAVVHQRGLEPRTRFTGLVTGSSRFFALAAADIVVYPSRDEVFGLVPLEALQAGTPVIVCDDAGCGEVIREVGGGLLVPPGDVRALAAAIGAILGDLPAWREKAVSAGAEAARRFHPDLVAAQLEGVYRDAIARS